MRSNRLAWALVVLAAFCSVAAIGCFWGPGRTPQGQKPLFELSKATFNEFESAFDSGSEGPRLVVLLSPT